jgi:hypothetical protein
MDFKIPESIEGLSLDDLRDLATQARAAGKEIAAKDDADITADEHKHAAALLNFIAEVDAAITTAEEEDAARAQTLAALRGLDATDENETETEAEEESEEPVDETDDAPEAEAEVTADSEEKEPVVAAAPRKPVTKRASQVAPVVEKDDEKDLHPKAVITASAPTRNFTVGQEITDLNQAAKLTLDRLGDLPTTGRSRVKLPAFTITKGRGDGLVAGASAKDDLQEVLSKAVNEARLPGGSLTAAAGWCAPSETVYDLCPGLETTDGIWSVPEVQVARGGLRFTKGPDFADIYALGGFDLTETEIEEHDPVEDGPLKDCWEVPCPDFTDVRLDAVGLCVTAGLLQRAGYPEVIERYLSGALVAHQHRVAAKLIQAALSIAGAATTVTNPHPNAVSLLTALELVVQGERQRYRLGLTQSLEVVLPFWVKSAIRADLAQRTGVDLLNVTDQQIQTFFSTRGANVQFIYNWQPLTLGGGGSNPAIDYPSTVEALIYPAGTFTKLSDDVISLSTLYDHDMLTNNMYTALFFEEGVALANTCYTPKRISLAIPVSGLTAAANINQDWGATGPLNQVPIIEVEAGA